MSQKHKCVHTHTQSAVNSLYQPTCLQKCPTPIIYTFPGLSLSAFWLFDYHRYPLATTELEYKDKLHQLLQNQDYISSAVTESRQTSKISVIFREQMESDFPQALFWITIRKVPASMLLGQKSFEK